MKKLYMMLLQKAIMSKKRKLRTLVKELSKRNQDKKSYFLTIRMTPLKYTNSCSRMKS